MNLTKEQEWLQSLKAGDEVAIYSRSNGYKIASVDKITPTRQIKIGNDTFKNGYCKGASTWDYGKHLHPITQEIKDWIRKGKLVRTLEKTKFNDIPLETLEAIYTLLGGEQENEPI